MRLTNEPINCEHLGFKYIYLCIDYIEMLFYLTNAVQLSGSLENLLTETYFFFFYLYNYTDSKNLSCMIFEMNILPSIHELSTWTIIYSQHKLYFGWLVSAAHLPLLIYIQLNLGQIYLMGHKSASRCFPMWIKRCKISYWATLEAFFLLFS